MIGFQLWSFTKHWLLNLQQCIQHGELTSSSPSSSSSSSNCISRHKQMDAITLLKHRQHKTRNSHLKRRTLSSSSRASPVKYKTALGTILSLKKWPISKSVAKVYSESSSCWTKQKNNFSDKVKMKMKSDHFSQKRFSKHSKVN